MAMTLTEKILARASGQDRVRPGDLVSARVDLAFGQDTTMPLAVRELRRMEARRVFDPDKVVAACDPDARYHSVVAIDVSGLEFQVACPSSPRNVHPVSAVAGTPLDAVFRLVHERAHRRSGRRRPHPGWCWACCLCSRCTRHIR